MTKEIKTLRKRVSKLEYYEDIITVAPIYILFVLIFIVSLINGIIRNSDTWFVVAALQIINIILISLYIKL